MTTLPNHSISTSADLTDVRKLRHCHLGQEIRVMGRDVTLGQHQAPPTVITGVLQNLRMNKMRIVLVMDVQFPRRPVPQSRVIEVLIPGGH